MTKSGADSLIIIPAFNESASLGWVLERASSSASDFDVLVIDDGSRDNTGAIAEQREATVVSHPFNLGYGAALQTGYKWAERHGYAYLVQMDADGQHDPALAAGMVDKLRAGKADLVLGSRFAAPSGYQMGMTRTVGRLFFRRLLALLGGPPISDPTSGLQALSRAAFSFCCRDFYPTDFPDIDVLLLLHRNGFRIMEVPVTMRPSPSSRASMHAGVQAVYYTYKMLLSTFRSALAPKRRSTSGIAAQTKGSGKEGVK